MDVVFLMIAIVFVLAAFVFGIATLSQSPTVRIGSLQGVLWQLGALRQQALKLGIGLGHRR